jgi:hypothetical protein
MSLPDKTLLNKIRDAYVKVSEAEAALNEAAKAEKAELVSRSKALGLLLLQAQERHPKPEDFKAFLRDVQGLGISRAYDLMRVAGGRATEEQLREQARDRQRKRRAKAAAAKAAKKKAEQEAGKKSNPPAANPNPDPATPDTESTPEPKPDSVTEPPVTESSEAGAEEGVPQMAAPDMTDEIYMTDEEKSARALADFIAACHTHLPNITVEADRQKARALVAELTGVPTAEAA